MRLRRARGIYNLNAPPARVTGRGVELILPPRRGREPRAHSRRVITFPRIQPDFTAIKPRRRDLFPRAS